MQSKTRALKPYPIYYQTRLKNLQFGALAQTYIAHMREYPPTLDRKACSKLSISGEDQNERVGPFHITLEEVENGGFTLRRHKLFSVDPHYAGKFENSRITGHFENSKIEPNARLFGKQNDHATTVTVKE